MTKSFRCALLRVVGRVADAWNRNSQLSRGYFEEVVSKKSNPQSSTSR
jgi:hypothetical protein